MRQLKISKSITNRENESLDRYLHEISKVALITAEEEVQLAQQIKKGDQVALETLTKANLRFVVSVAKQYQNQGLSLGDLINEGNLGLMKAAQRFDETRGFKFISYAVWWIRQSILQALAEQSRIVRLPLNKVGALNRINRAFSKLEQEFEREPTADEIAELVELNEEEIIRTMRMAGRHISTDAPVDADDQYTMSDILQSPGMEATDDRLSNTESLKIEMEESLGSLSARQQQVVRMYFGFGRERGMSLEDIGNKLGLTRERVRQIKDKALSRLRVSARNSRLKHFLG